MKTITSGYLLLLLIVFSARAGATPIHWTLEDNCSYQPASLSLCGDFSFDLATASYSDVDIGFVICDLSNCYPTFFGQIFSTGDQYFLQSGLNPRLYMSGYDLSLLVPQSFRWSVSGSPGGFSGSGRLLPDTLPPPVPVPATVSLLVLALACGAWLRLTGRQQHVGLFRHGRYS